VDEDYITRALCSVLLTKYYSGDQLKRNKMGRACSTYGRYERCIQGFGGKPEGRSLQQRRSIWDNNIKTYLQTVKGSMNWIDVAQDRDWWRALVYTVMNLRVPYNAGSFLTS
jgi:hypothetical protein